VNPPGPRSPATEPPDTDPPGGPPTLTPSDGPFRRVIRVINPLGLHHRVADRFSRTANQFACTVTVWNGDQRADGKNIWDLIMLVVLPDAEVVLEVDGPDAPRAVAPLTAILASPGGEDYTI
jgi:phosphotransferase system HPr (HPr) family protein